MPSLLERIKRRGRNLEEDIDIDFIEDVTYRYEQFFENITKILKRSDVLVIDTDKLDAEQVFNMVKEHIMLNYYEKSPKSN